MGVYISGVKVPLVKAPYTDEGDSASEARSRRRADQHWALRQPHCMEKPKEINSEDDAPPQCRRCPWALNTQTHTTP